MPEDVLHAEPTGLREEEAPTANQRFKDAYRLIGALAVFASIGIHYLAFELFPHIQAADFELVEEALAAVELPPEVRIPPPPEAIVRPARPRVSETVLDEEITIGATTFEENPVSQLAPPPPSREIDPSEHPVYVDRDTEPRLLNGPEMLRLLARLYPSALKQAGIGGEVMLWVWVDEQGNPTRSQISQSSGREQLDDAALAIVSSMRFSPALLRDQPVGVWIAQPISFNAN